MFPVAYVDPGLPNAEDFHDTFPGYAYAAPGNDQHLAIDLRLQRARHDSGGLNPRALSFEPHHTGANQRALDSVAGNESRQDARGALNSGGRSLERYDSSAHQRALDGQLSGSHPRSLTSITRHDVRAPSCFQNFGAGHLPGRHPISPNSEASNRNPFALVSESRVRQIWRENCCEAFEEIKRLVANRQGLLYIGLDMEYLAHDTTDIRFRPFTSEQWYSSLQEYVNKGSVVQIGLALAFEQQSREIFVYELNLLVDVENGNFHQDAVKFLEGHKHNLTKHREVGILPEWVYTGLLRYLPFGDESVVWVAYHGDRDIAFLLKLIEGGGNGVCLPSSLRSFHHQFVQKFPHYYDVRVLSQMVKQGFRGKLTVLAGEEFLNLKRRGGEHHAGSDALLTLECFGEILKGYKLEGIIARRCLLSGIEELQLPITCYRHVTSTDVNVVDVFERNFDEEATLVSQTISNNFKTIGLQVIAFQDLHTVKPDYTVLRSAVGKVDCFELLLAFMNQEGNLAYGRAWKFFLKVQDGDGSRVNPLRLAALLAPSGSSHDENSEWVTHGGEYVLACLRNSFIAPRTLPLSLVKYNLVQSSIFPHVYDVKKMVGACQGPETTGEVRETALHLGVAEDVCDVVTVLRCFCSLRGNISKGTDDQP